MHAYFQVQFCKQWNYALSLRSSHKRDECRCLFGAHRRCDGKEEKTLSYIKQKESVRITFSDERKLNVNSVKDTDMAILNATQIVNF
jgi:hypothetical protein